jgi:hypothetical protein
MTLLGYVNRDYLVQLAEAEGGSVLMSADQSWMVDFLVAPVASEKKILERQMTERKVVEKAAHNEKWATLKYATLPIQLQTTMTLDEVHMLFITLHLVRAFVTVKGELKGTISRVRLRHALRIS